MRDLHMQDISWEMVRAPQFRASKRPPVGRSGGMVSLLLLGRKVGFLETGFSRPVQLSVWLGMRLLKYARPLLKISTAFMHKCF